MLSGAPIGDLLPFYFFDCHAAQAVLWCVTVGLSMLEMSFKPKLSSYLNFISEHSITSEGLLLSWISEHLRSRSLSVFHPLAQILNVVITSYSSMAHTYDSPAQYHLSRQKQTILKRHAIWGCQQDMISSWVRRTHKIQLLQDLSWRSLGNRETL